MVSSEVQRTLVKSPPELWAELSDPAALARHLGELGEIRITRVEPEKKVEWEADDASGIVLLDPSGWGTRVTLTVTREIVELDSPPGADALAERESPLAPNSPPEPQASPPAESEPIVEAESDLPIDAEPELESHPQAAVAFENAPEAREQRELDLVPPLEPRRGFFARLFGRRRADAQPAVEPAETALEQAPEPRDAFAGVAGALAPETFAAARPFAAVHLAAEPTHDQAHINEPPGAWDEPHARSESGAWDEPEAATAEASPANVESWSELETTSVSTESDTWAESEAEEADAPTQAQEHQATDTSAEIRAAEEVAAEQVTAVLTSVLDRLGAAHHRPFSRA